MNVPKPSRRARPIPASIEVIDGIQYLPMHKLMHLINSVEYLDEDNLYAEIRMMDRRCHTKRKPHRLTTTSATATKIK